MTVTDILIACIVLGVYLAVGVMWSIFAGIRFGRSLAAFVTFTLLWPFWIVASIIAVWRDDP